MASPELQTRIDELIKRAQAGNQKLNLAYRQLLDTEEISKADASWQEAMKKWGEATRKLNLIITELMADGYNECLYIEDGRRTRRCFPEDGTFCLGCPAPADYMWNEMDSATAARRKTKMQPDNIFTVGDLPGKPGKPQQRGLF